MLIGLVRSGLTEWGQRLPNFAGRLGGRRSSVLFDALRWPLPVSLLGFFSGHWKRLTQIFADSLFAVGTPFQGSFGLLLGCRIKINRMSRGETGTQFTCPVVVSDSSCGRGLCWATLSVYQWASGS